MAILETVLHSTLEKSRKKLFFAALKSNVLMAWAFANNRVDYEDGGAEITNPLTVGRNPNVAAYSYYQQLPISQTNEFTTVRYFWSRVAGTVIISDQEEDENRGETAIFKLMKAKMDVLQESIKEKFSGFLYGAGVGFDPQGLASLIPDDPTVGFMGGIDRAREPQWRTSSYQFNGALNKTNIEQAYDDVLLDMTVRGEKPDIILIGRDQHRLYSAAVRDKAVIPLSEANMGKQMMDLGFKGFSHCGIPIIYDEDCPVAKAYFINSKYLRLSMLRHVNFKIKQLNAPWTMDASGRRVIWQGQWCMWKAFRTHAVVNNGPTV